MLLILDELIEDIHKKWKGDHTRLERHHGYIQWLFPIRERGLNWQAQELQSHEIEVNEYNVIIIMQTARSNFSYMLYIHVQSILADPVAHKRILTSYELMLDFYGMKLKDPKTGRFTTF